MKNSIGIFVLLLVLIGLVMGCGPGSKEIAPLTVKLKNVIPIWADSEAVIFVAEFEVSNPNQVDVTLESLDLNILGENYTVGAAQYSKGDFIAAGKKITIQHAFPVVLANIIGDMMISQGFPQTKAIGLALPIWKSFGGVLPKFELASINDILKALAAGKMTGQEAIESINKAKDLFAFLWSSAPDKKPVFSVKGVENINVGGISKSFSFTCNP